MNRNVESHFSELPTIDIERSIFDRSASHKTSFNVGELIPFYVDEVLPGDTFNVTTSCVVRLQTPLTPIMDNLYLDTYYFYIPSRILQNSFVEVMGENKAGPWVPATEHNVALIKPPENGWNVGTIADYMGIPPGVGPSEGKLKYPVALPFRAYAMCVDQWFLDQNVQDHPNIHFDDTTRSGSNSDNYITGIELGGKPFICGKFRDYFVSCLPSPQKGPDVGLTYNFFNQQARNYPYVPVIASNDIHRFVTNQGLKGVFNDDPTVQKYLTRYTTGGREYITAQGTEPDIGYFIPNNLWADLSGTVDNIHENPLSVNDLRIAFQLQKYYEKAARGGTRYREILAEMFSVRSSDARFQIPEYLGGHRIPLSIHQVANQSQGESDFLGDLGAMSNTSDVHEDFVKSFEEFGYILGLCVVRYDHSYPQGLERFWTRSGKLDYYWPVFANVGEQPVFKQEIMWTSEQTGYEVFGYQEAWAEYRYKPNRVSGEMRPGIANSLASWHLADNYASVPSLSSDWIKEDKSNVDRVLSVTSAVSNQVFADFYVKNICTRAMPMYSIPGLIDHH